MQPAVSSIVCSFLAPSLSRNSHASTSLLWRIAPSCTYWYEVCSRVFEVTAPLDKDKHFSRPPRGVCGEALKIHRFQHRTPGRGGRPAPRFSRAPDSICSCTGGRGSLVGPALTNFPLLSPSSSSLARQTARRGSPWRPSGKLPVPTLRRQGGRRCLREAAAAGESPRCLRRERRGAPELCARALSRGGGRRARGGAHS